MSEDVLIPLAAIGLPMLLVPSILTFRHVAKKRDLQHIERMKALETGRPVPGESYWPQAFVCTAIGAGVPVASFLLTLMAWVSRHGTPPEIWIAPTIVSFIAVAGGVHASTTMFRPSRAATPTDAHLNGKPSFDPDAYDVVGSRG